MTSTIIIFYSSLSLLVLLSIIPCHLAFTIPSNQISRRNNVLCQSPNFFSKLQLGMKHSSEGGGEIEDRRSFLAQYLASSLFITTGLFSDNTFSVANAIESDGSTSTSSSTSTTADAQITSKIFIQLKGLPSDPDTFEEDIITIGLFGKDSPQPVSLLEQLVSTSGYLAKCKPKEIRTLQREQLEANKVYNVCMESQDTKGVTYDLSTVWRIIPNERIDLGAVSGKFVARESPSFEGSNSLKHDAEGVVSVRSGNDSGFSFTIYPGTGSKRSDLDETHIVVGRVISGMDVVRKLNQVPVIQSSLAGGDPSKRSAPSRACRYGSSELYCNEFKPLKKISIFRSGTLN